MNLMEKVCADLKEKIQNQNFNLEMRGQRSNEFQVSRIILNTTLESHVLSGFIDDFEFTFKEIDENVYIYKLTIFLGSDLQIIITDDEVEYDLHR